MTALQTDRTKFARAFLLLLLLFVSVVFFRMIQDFLVAVVLGALTAALAQPVYHRLPGAFRGRPATAASVTLFLVLLVVVTPLLLAAGAVASEAADLAVSARTWTISHPDTRARSRRISSGFPYTTGLPSLATPSFANSRK